MVSVSSQYSQCAAGDGFSEPYDPISANRKRKQKFTEGLTTSSFSLAEEAALWQIRGRPVIDGTVLGLSSEQTGVSIGRPVATGLSATGLSASFYCLRLFLAYNPHTAVGRNL